MVTDKRLLELKKVIPFRFRTGSGMAKGSDGKPTKYRVVAYVDSRDVMDRLDEICGPAGWTRKHESIGGKMFCHVSINTIGGGWVTRSDVGSPSNIEKDKGEASDSFKRACVNRGIGRFLYSVPSFVITKEEAMKNKRDITSFVRKRFKTELMSWYKANEVKHELLESKYAEQLDVVEEAPTIEDIDMKNFSNNPTKEGAETT